MTTKVKCRPERVSKKLVLKQVNDMRDAERKVPHIKKSTYLKANASRHAHFMLI
jgi:hypothetical protein